MQRCHIAQLHDGLKRSGKALLHRYQREGDDFLGRIVAMDEAWTRSQEPNLKCQSNEWKHPGSPRPKKVRPTQSAVKMFIVAYDTDGGGQYGTSTKMDALMVYDAFQTFGKRNNYRRVYSRVGNEFLMILHTKHVLTGTRKHYRKKISAEIRRNGRLANSSFRGYVAVVINYGREGTTAVFSYSVIKKRRYLRTWHPFNDFGLSFIRQHRNYPICAYIALRTVLEKSFDAQLLYKSQKGGCDHDQTYNETKLI
ncbi:hypothetical protein ANN_14780 [Periplaneta americana]|uniref:Uncharacterized protein n=1 Tax=Periplaneta americana TaxID=6978 RepID=A0ABQ8SYU5_PERAM|nr:hypothetical protein ANN_14780 [Periplaneta americana]